MRALVVSIALSLVTSVAAAQSDGARGANGASWVAIGDALAGGPDADGLERALDAYARVAPSDADYAAALQRAAWTCFLLDRSAEAIARYVAFVDRLDALHLDGPARDEAIAIMGAMLADLDWDHDGAPDVPSAAVRLSDPSIVPQDRPWLGALWFETAHALYLSSRDPAAIALIDDALARWPAPLHGTSMEAACRRHRARPVTLRVESADALRATDAVCARRAP